jgi:glyoxylase-like metal-dependent hydrolase (beta-lactamase superfamily II)
MMTSERANWPAEWEVYALKYADRNNRIRGDSFIFDDNHDAPHPIDYFIWVLKRGEHVIVVDTGYDSAEANRRDRPIHREPAAALLDIGVRAEDVDTVIITHLHYDHAGGLTQFPNATIHLQAAEMAYATGPCMCHGTLKMPFTADHVCEAVKRVYSGRVIFHEGDGEVADGVTVHCIGGHSRGLQVVRVRTAAGWLCLASDATHFYENIFTGKPFPIVVDLEDMFRGFARLQTLASHRNLIIPGHDPLVLDLFEGPGPGHVVRLDHGPTRDLPF